MKHYFLFILLLAAAATGGCTEELQPETNGTNGAVFDEGELAEALLNLSVNTFVVEAQVDTRASMPSGTPEQETAEEKEIHDIWVFQYDAATQELLIKPRYYTVTDQAMLQDLPVYLKAGVPSVVHVVTNTGYDNWANDGTDASWQKFRQLEQLKKQTLPTAFPLRSIDKVSIPMAGASEEVEVMTGITVTVPVTRMYAKLKVKVEMLKAEMKLNNVNVRQIPNICRVETLAGDGNDEPMDAVPFPDGTTFGSIAFAASDLEKNEDKEWAVFYVPENLQGETETQGGSKSDAAPSNALVVDITTEVGGERYLYEAYPGGNSFNNFNIQRNQVYRITVTITGEKGQNNPSANCFVIAPEAGSEITFNPHDSPGTDVAGTEIVYADQVIEDQYSRIADVRTVWQTAENLISVIFADGLVRVVPNAKGVDGNALIAAYATDNTTILWSWHIWVTPYAKVLDGTGTNGYIHTLKDNNNTFDWMDRNLGVLNVYRDADNRNLYYQWGRKDPFYDTSKTTINSDGTGISAADKGTALNIDESVKNPTVFFQQSSGGKTGTWHGGTSAITNLWDPDTKTVFDPCPAGWRVPEKVAWDFYKWGSSGNIAWDTTNSFGAVLTVSSGVYSWFPGGILKNDLTFDARSIYMWSSEWKDSYPQTYYIRYYLENDNYKSVGGIANSYSGFLGGSVRCVKVK